MAGTQYIAKIALDEKSVVRRNADIEHERKVAIFDILEQNHFAVNGHENGGPYSLHLSIEDNRLIFDIRSENDETGLARVPLPVISFRRIIKDYFHVCESYFDAIKTGSPSKIEAIDMGRRGLHNEGSELLKERLKDKVETDFDTARRLFTLMCILHIRG
ncbi:MAG: hypothetical protein CMN55_16210 [Sneathiella sp.]|jgi:uncharacterized protein (UPF0262 family)|uniref:UPF0262 family protein n=1 Tax=Sneathiella sp. TaxID=1964365 RepID=UPI000C5B1D2E|nr:UPF0262 family protein [Sneathiella sp.]MAL80622.1 hypothetical protein [Sneathiella sp.]